MPLDLAKLKAALPSDYGVTAPLGAGGQGAVFLGTWPHGAITVRSGPGGMAVETFTTGQRFVVVAGKRP